jgi:hypothetical protein
MTYVLGLLTLSYSNGYIINKELKSPKAGGYKASYGMGSLKTYVDSVYPEVREFQFNISCSSRIALLNLFYYDISNYDWQNSSAIYLVEDSTRRWRVYGCFIEYNKSDNLRYDCVVTLLLSAPASLGETEHQKAGSATSSPTTIEGFSNAGNVSAPLISVEITGKYAGGANLTAAVLAHDVLGYDIEIADVLMDEALMTFYPDDLYCKLVASDPVESITRTDRNKLSSSGVTFSVDSLVFANSSSLVMRYQIGHPLLNDPVLTMSVTDIVGTPLLEVSNDGNYWWAVDKDIVAEEMSEYTLTKLAGFSDFRWRLSCGAAASMKLGYYSLLGYFSISGQRILPYIQAAATDEDLSLTFSAGNATYDIRWRDKYAV